VLDKCVYLQTSYHLCAPMMMQENGAPEQKVTLQNFNRGGKNVDVTVAAVPLKAGDIALRIPDSLVVTLDRIFEDGGVAELLTTSKLSELACLTLFLCYEKKRGKDSSLYPFIKELDRQAGRGPQGARSPLLWDEAEVQELLAGSPVISAINERLQGIEKEYNELDTVWFMGSSLFKNYPFEIPTEQFSFEVFKQAFVAIQGSVVHLQGVELSRRFALVPLGPPLLSYSSTAKAILTYCEEDKEVQLAVDRDYLPGQPIYAWCGPQPNSKLLINYGVVDAGNPYDKMPLTIIIPSHDPFYRMKRGRLAELQFSTQQTFQLSAMDPLPENLLSYLRLTFAKSEEDIWKVEFGTSAACISEQNECIVLSALINHLQERLGGYKTSIDEDDAVIADPSSTPRHAVASRLLRIEKTILLGTLNSITQLSKDYDIGIVSDTGGVMFV